MGAGSSTQSFSDSDSEPNANDQTQQKSPGNIPPPINFKKRPRSPLEPPKNKQLIIQEQKYFYEIEILRNDNDSEKDKFVNFAKESVSSTIKDCHTKKDSSGIVKLLLIFNFSKSTNDYTKTQEYYRKCVEKLDSWKGLSILVEEVGFDQTRRNYLLNEFCFRMNKTLVSRCWVIQLRHDHERNFVRQQGIFLTLYCNMIFNGFEISDTDSGPIKIIYEGDMIVPLKTDSFKENLELCVQLHDKLAQMGMKELVIDARESWSFVSHTGRMRDFIVNQNLELLMSGIIKVLMILQLWSPWCCICIIPGSQRKEEYVKDSSLLPFKTDETIKDFIQKRMPPPVTDLYDEKRALVLGSTRMSTLLKFQRISESPLEANKIKEFVGKFQDLYEVPVFGGDQIKLLEIIESLEIAPKKVSRKLALLFVDIPYEYSLYVACKNRKKGFLNKFVGVSNVVFTSGSSVIEKGKLIFPLVQVEEELKNDFLVSFSESASRNHNHEVGRIEPINLFVSAGCNAGFISDVLSESGIRRGVNRCLYHMVDREEELVIGSMMWLEDFKSQHANFNAKPRKDPWKYCHKYPCIVVFSFSKSREDYVIEQLELLKQKVEDGRFKNGVLVMFRVGVLRPDKKLILAINDLIQGSSATVIFNESVLLERQLLEPKSQTIRHTEAEIMCRIGMASPSSWTAQNLSIDKLLELKNKNMPTYFIATDELRMVAVINKIYGCAYVEELQTPLVKYVESGLERANAVIKFTTRGNSRMFSVSGFVWMKSSEANMNSIHQAIENELNNLTSTTVTTTTTRRRVYDKKINITSSSIINPYMYSVCIVTEKKPSNHFPLSAATQFMDTETIQEFLSSTVVLRSLKEHIQKYLEPIQLSRCHQTMDQMLNHINSRWVLKSNVANYYILDVHKTSSDARQVIKRLENLSSDSMGIVLVGISLDYLPDETLREINNFNTKSKSLLFCPFILTRTNNESNGAVRDQYLCQIMSLITPLSTMALGFSFSYNGTKNLSAESKDIHHIRVWFSPVITIMLQAMKIKSSSKSRLLTVKAADIHKATFEEQRSIYTPYNTLEVVIFGDLMPLENQKETSNGSIFRNDLLFSDSYGEFTATGMRNSLHISIDEQLINLAMDPESDKQVFTKELYELFSTIISKITSFKPQKDT